MSVAKIRVKVGSMELEYEGDPDFLTGGIEELLTTMGELSKASPSSVLAPEIAEQQVFEAASPDNFSFSTNTIAAHLDAKTGPELVICAMAQLELVQGKSSSERSSILAEMKSATTYYNENMRGNMTKILASLVKSKRINNLSKGTYSLSASERKRVEGKVAEIG